MTSQKTNLNKNYYLHLAAYICFAMVAFQTVLSLSPAAAAYFQCPPSLLSDPLRLFLIGEAAALIPLLLGLYALSGAGVIRHLPFRKTVLIVFSILFLLRGMFIVVTILKLAGVLEGEVLIQGVASHFIFLLVGVLLGAGALTIPRVTR
jgi:hypothetical protein